MKFPSTSVFVATLCLSLVSFAPSAISQGTPGEEPLVIESNNENLGEELSGQKLTVSGNGNEIKVLGQCSVLVVTGNNNTIKVKAVDRIVITGKGNTIVWASAIQNDIPKIEDDGKNNTISSGSIDS